MIEPQRLPVDPEVAVAAFRFRSRSAPGRTYDVAFAPDGTASCECWPFLKVDRCAHVVAARQELANERRREARQAERDARLGCPHRCLVIEDGDRWCLGCGVRYPVARWVAGLARLREDIQARHRLPSSPWTAGERSEDSE